MQRLRFGWWRAPQRRSSFRTTALAVCAALAATHLGAVPAAGEDEQQPAATAAEALGAPATAGPAATDREVPELRTRTSATYANLDHWGAPTAPTAP